MKRLVIAALFVSSFSAFASDYRCSSGRVEKSGSTQYTYKESSSEIVIEKGGSTKGKAVKRGSKWYVEIGGSTAWTRTPPRSSTSTNGAASSRCRPPRATSRTARARVSGSELLHSLTRERPPGPSHHSRPSPVTKRSVTPGRRR